MSASNSLIYLRDTIFGEFLDRREGLTEIAVNRPNQIYTKEKGIWIPHDVDLSYQDCADLLQPLSNYSNNYIGDDNPILSATLHTGERVQAILPPVCLDGHISITIRKPSDVFISHEDFVKQGFYSRLNHPERYEAPRNKLIELYNEKRFEEFIPECFRQGKTVVFNAGTGAGKTTFANSVLYYIDHHLRILFIEDTDEAKPRFHDNHVKMFYPSEGGENAVITPAKLLRGCFRMNGDRILMTEVRGAETWDFLKASSSGHRGNATTVHEDTIEDTIIGMVTRCYMNPECKQLPYNVILRKVLNNIDVIMSMEYIDKENLRFASGLYFKDLHMEEYWQRLREVR